MKLSNYLEINKISVAEFGRRVGKTRSTVHRYCTLDRIPPIPILIKIKELTDGNVGTFEDWVAGGKECQTQ